MKQIKQWAFGASVAATVLFSFAVVLQPDLKTAARSVFYPEYRMVLSRVDGDLFGTGEKIKVLKIKSTDGLSIEIYRANEANTEDTLIQSIALGTNSDAYFAFNGESTNLALDDINRDSKPEILVPSVDKQLVAKMLILELDSNSQTYHLSQVN
jgi:hypothetical protein